MSSTQEPEPQSLAAAIAAQSPEQASLAELGDDALTAAPDMPIRLPTFEGPLDLLLFLIRRNEIDIYDIPIESVTKQYLEVLHSMKELNLEVAGDFFVMAATLMYIKSRMLLPTNEQVSQPQEESDDEDADPRWELVQQLLEYKKYKEAAFELQSLVERRQDFIERFCKAPDISESDRDLEPSDRIDLWNTFNKVLRRLADRIVKGEIQDEEISVAQSMEYILNTIKVRSHFRFTELLEGKRLTVAFLISTFLAVLELTRLKRLTLTQDAVFGEIECTRRDDPEDEGEDVVEDEAIEAAAAIAEAALAAGSAALASGALAAAKEADGARPNADGTAEGADDTGYENGDSENDFAASESGTTDEDFDWEAIDETDRNSSVAETEDADNDPAGDTEASDEVEDDDDDAFDWEDDGDEDDLNDSDEEDGEEDEEQ